MSEHDQRLERAIDALKEPVALDPFLGQKVMARVAELPPPERSAARHPVLAWFTRPRPIALSPLGGLAMAAGVAALIVIARFTAPPAEPSVPAPANASVIQFVLVAPDAGSVSVVGDFNDWNVAATPLVQDPGRGVWSVTVPLTPGRYRYSFLIDGTTWTLDPRAVRTVEDDFGRPNSVLMVGGA